MAWWWIAFVAWIGFGVQLWRRASVFEPLLSRISERMRPVAALGILFGGLAVVIAVLLVLQRAQGIAPDGTPTIGSFVVVLAAGCLFVGSQILAASLVLGSVLGKK